MITNTGHRRAESTQRNTVYKQTLNHNLKRHIHGMIIRIIIVQRRSLTNNTIHNNELMRRRQLRLMTNILHRMPGNISTIRMVLTNRLIRINRRNPIIRIITVSRHLTVSRTETEILMIRRSLTTRKMLTLHTHTRMLIIKISLMSKRIRIHTKSMSPSRSIHIRNLRTHPISNKKLNNIVKSHNMNDRLYIILILSIMLMLNMPPRTTNSRRGHRTRSRRRHKRSITATPNLILTYQVTAHKAEKKHYHALTIHT